MAEPSSLSNTPDNPPHNTFGILLTTAGSREEAAKIAILLLENHWAACVNYFAVESVYRWQGQIQQETEWQLMIKTDLALQETIATQLKAIHSYELPEFIVIPLQGGSAAYLEWLGQQVSVNR